MQLTALQYAEITSAGLKIGDNHLNFLDWQAMGDQLKTIEGSVKFWIGDWLNYGEAHYGEEFAQVLNPDNPQEMDVMRQAQRVAKAFPLNERHTHLSFTHHYQVYNRDDRKELLNLAEEKRWTVKNLRDEIVERNALGKPEPAPVEWVTPPPKIFALPNNRWSLDEPDEGPFFTYVLEQGE